MFNYLLYDDRKQDTATTAAHSKRIIELFQKWTLLFDCIIKIWENTDGCTDQYCCATALYLLSMLAHAYNIIIDCGVGAPVNDREVVDGLNYTYKQLFSMVKTTVQLPVAADYE